MVGWSRVNQPIRETPALGWFSHQMPFLSLSTEKISLLEEFTSFGYRHLCFDVDDVDAVYAQLQKRGVHFLRAPVTNNTIRKRILLIQDNNGLVIEFAQNL